MTDKAEWIDWHGGECPVDALNHIDDVEFKHSPPSTRRLRGWSNDNAQ